MTGGYEIGGPNSGDLEELALLAERLQEADLEVARAEEALRRAQKIQSDLAEHQIPEKMDEVGVETFRTKSGFTISVKETIRASIPAARKDEAFQWLEDHGHGGLIKRTVVVGFDREEEAQARNLVQQLGSEFENVKTDRKVEPSTLRAFIAERLRAEEDIPLALFGAYRQRVAKVTASQRS
jgi:hypothetical protein